MFGILRSLLQLAKDKVRDHSNDNCIMKVSVVINTREFNKKSHQQSVAISSQFVVSVFVHLYCVVYFA